MATVSTDAERVQAFRARYADVSDRADAELAAGKGASDFDLEYWCTATRFYHQKRNMFHVSEKDMKAETKNLEQRYLEFVRTGLSLEYLELLGLGKTPAKKFGEAIAAALPKVAVPDLYSMIAGMRPKVVEQELTPVWYNPEIEKSVGAAPGSFAPIADAIARDFSVPTIVQGAKRGKKLKRVRNAELSQKQLEKLSNFLELHTSSGLWQLHDVSHEESKRAYKEFWGPETDTSYFDTSSRNRRAISYSLSFSFGDGAAPGPRKVWKDGYFRTQFEAYNPAVHARLYTSMRPGKAMDMASRMLEWARAQKPLPSFEGAFQMSGDMRETHFNKFVLDVPFGEVPRVVSLLKQNADLFHQIANTYSMGVPVLPGVSAVIEGPCKDHCDFNYQMGEKVAFTKPHLGEEEFVSTVISKLVAEPATRDHTLFLLGKYQFELVEPAL